MEYEANLSLVQHKITREELEKALAEKTGWGKNEILARFDSLGFVIASRMSQEVMKLKYEQMKEG